MIGNLEKVIRRDPKSILFDLAIALVGRIRFVPEKPNPSISLLDHFVADFITQHHGQSDSRTLAP